VASTYRSDRRYTVLFIPGHPLASKTGYVYEHRLVLSQKLGRWLRPEEHTHHINGNRRDNRPENLLLVSKGKHRQFHLLPARPCPICGEGTVKWAAMCKRCYYRKHHPLVQRPTPVPGSLLRDLRRAAAVRQTQLAAALGVHQCDVSSLETGRKELAPEVYHRAALAIHEMKGERDRRFAEIAAGGVAEEVPQS
jgi:DNA-binding transcriptional regulator YiaG